MKNTLLSALIFTAAATTAPCENTTTTTAPRWWEPYSGPDAREKQVLGFWRFNSKTDPGKDESRHKLPGKIRGSKWHADGKFGGCLEGGAGYPFADEPHGFLIPRAQVPAPVGAFTLEMWLRPGQPEAFPTDYHPIIADSKYVSYNHTGFLWSITREDGDGTRQFQLEIGLGTRSETWFSEPFRLPPDEWRHAAFTYDGLGTAVFFVDGAEIGHITKPGAAAMAASVRDLVIGDRIGSNYRGFPGWIDEVRFSAGTREFRPLKIEPEASRPAFVRLSRDATVRAKVTNLTADPLENLKLTVAVSRDKEPATIPVAVLPPGESQALDVPIDTSLRPGEYTIRITAETPGWGGDDATHRSTSRLSFVIVPRPLPHRMPVVMWGLGGTEGVLKGMPKLKDIGFTHCLGLRVNYDAIWKDGADALAASPDEIRVARDMLDRALENDIGIIATISPGRWLRTAAVGEPFLRIDRKGEHYGREDISGLFPRVQEFCYDTGAALARAYGDHPAFAATLMHTEVRGESQVSFHPVEREAARKALGIEIPDAVTIKNGVEYSKLPGFPEDRVIPDDDPILSYLRWFWTEGDGWNTLNTRLHEGLVSGIDREDFWTFHDPAVRVPSIRGSGGTADVLSHWTYSYPDPIRIGLCVDELFEMARVNGLEQDVMKMTQIIWYRSQTAPDDPPEGTEPSPWVDRDPGAAYITIAPMHLREALWWKLARPITGIMYHGWGSLVDTDSPGSYTFTNPNTAGELRRLIREVVTPLGPTLLQIADAPSDVAFLESFTSQMFARRGTYGWNHRWAGDLYHVLMYAQLQPRVLYEESLLAGSLEGAKILVMGDCDVLTKSVVDKVNAFQKKGGIVVGDNELCPAILPDIVVPRYERTKNAAADRAALQALASELKTGLDGKYRWPLRSDNPDVVTRRRMAGNADYLFAVNDRRETGDYVGNYGLVMENGLPSAATLRLRRARGHVYDLQAGRRIEAKETANGHLEIPVALGPCEGRLLMVTERPVENLTLKTPEHAQLGSRAEIRIAVTDREGAPVDAVIPVDLRILDPEGVEMEHSGYYGAADGELSVTLDIAPNDPVGIWELRATEKAAGTERRAYLRVNAAD